LPTRDRIWRTGFLGRRIVRHLQNADFAVRIASRHPDRGRSLFSRDVSSIEPFRAPSFVASRLLEAAISPSRAEHYEGVDRLVDKGRKTRPRIR